MPTLSSVMNLSLDMLKAAIITTFNIPNGGKAVPSLACIP